MAYTSYSYPPSTLLFPPAHVVKAYLDSFANHFKLRQHIRFNTAVQTACWDESELIWKITTTSPSQMASEPLEFDFLFVCNGHYRKPFYPSVPGLDNWIQNGTATHSAWYRRPVNHGKVVLVVGAGPSGNDISDEMSNTTDVIIRSMTNASPSQSGNIKIRGRVSQYLEGGQIVFEDGTTESGIDHCILATGYEMDFPFFSEPELLKDLPPPCPPLPPALYNSTFSIFPLAKHIFPIQNLFPPASVAFLGLPIKVAPFPVMEAQAQAALRVLDEPTALDLTQASIDIVTHYEEVRERLPGPEVTHRDIIRSYHKFTDIEQFEYRDHLYEFAFKGTDREGGPDEVKVPAWVIEAYAGKDALRRVWKEIVKAGEAEEIVKGVGEGGPHEWIELLQKLLKRGRDENEEKSRL
jgi:hypothetical protein